MKIARESREQYDILVERAEDQNSGLSPDDRAQIRRSAEAVAEEACRTALAATPETDFNSAYEIRDALIKQTFGGRVKPGESADAAQQRAYDDYIREAVLQLARDGVGYSEQSSSLKKLAGKITPERVEAVVDQLITEGRLAPGQVDIRMLGMTITGHFGERDPDLPPVRTGERSSDEAYGRDVAATTRAIGHPGTVGSDVGGPELYTFDATGKARFIHMYRALLTEAKRTGSPAVFRPHVGEGAVDNLEGKAFHTDKDRHVRDGEPSHYARARANIDAMLDTLAQLQAEGILDPAKVIVRLGHVTHATPEQAARMRSLGVIAEVNLGSNVATGAVSQTIGIDGPRSPVERFDDHSLPTLLYYDAPIAISTDAGAVMSTTLRAEYQRAHEIIEQVLAGARPIRVRTADATLGNVARGREVAGHPDERDLTITDLTPAERGRFLHAYEKLYADAERYYLRRPKPRGSGRNPTSAASPFAGAHHVAIAADHGLVPSQGTATYEGVRSDIEAAARAYRAKGYFVGSEMKAGQVVLFTVRSPDGDFETTLRSWGGDGPSYIPFAQRSPTDPPLTNRDVRAWYKQQIARIEALNEGWISEGVPLEERARRAYEIRKHARLAAREQMSSTGEVASLEVRDLSEHGEPDGPEFEQLVEDNMARGMTREQALEAIIGSSRRPNAGYDRKHGMGAKQE